MHAGCLQNQTIQIKAVTSRMYVVSYCILPTYFYECYLRTMLPHVHVACYMRIESILPV